MFTPICDVEGCRHEARWVRTSRADADLHKLLCSRHWRLLGTYSESAAAAYEPLGDLDAAHPTVRVD